MRFKKAFIILQLLLLLSPFILADFFHNHDLGVNLQANLSKSHDQTCPVWVFEKGTIGAVTSVSLDYSFEHTVTYLENIAQNSFTSFNTESLQSRSPPISL